LKWTEELELKKVQIKFTCIKGEIQHTLEDFSWNNLGLGASYCNVRQK